MCTHAHKVVECITQGGEIMQDSYLLHYTQYFSHSLKHISLLLFL